MPLEDESFVHVQTGKMCVACMWELSAGERESARVAEYRSARPVGGGGPFYLCEEHYNSLGDTWGMELRGERRHV